MRGTPSAGPRAARVLCEWSWRLRSCSSPLILKRISRCALDTLTSLGTSGSGHGGALVGHIHVPAGRGPIVLADRHHVGQRPAHQVQHVRVLWIQQVCISNKPPQTPVWPALERRRALAVSRAPPGPPCGECFLISLHTTDLKFQALVETIFPPRQQLRVPSSCPD